MILFSRGSVTRYHFYRSAHSIGRLKKSRQKFPDEFTFIIYAGSKRAEMIKVFPYFTEFPISLKQ